MKRLCRRGAWICGMILMFLLLASHPCARGFDSVVVSSASSSAPKPWADDDMVPPGRVRPLWFHDAASYSQPDTQGPPDPLEPDLRRALEHAGDDQTVRAIITLRDRVDVNLMAASGSASAAQARETLVSRLQSSAAQTQAAIRLYLDREKAVGRVVHYEPLWITNAIAVRAQSDVIRSLAERSSVRSVEVDHWRRWVMAEPVDSAAMGSAARRGWRGATSPASETAAAIEWNVSRIRADEVWESLHISGTGAVVAGMDTGVDWLHPALQATYRGYNPHGPTDHRYSWFDATEAGALYPVDGHGHGSHTLGTLAGGSGIGVAPGAHWIGVRVLDNQGYGYDSWIHAGFQWVLAPGGDPSRAPDVVNCSWGSNNPHLETFREDLQALRAAGILPVFSAGNEGDDAGSVGSPASLPEAFSVGAVDEVDEVANFSGRGPSPWGEIRPHVVAPGVHVRSSTPGGAYEEMDGTSMAAPHASGIAALLRSVSPTLSITRVTYAITSTAVPLGGEEPNNDTGWGRVDAFAAVSSVAQPGFISGTVRHRGSGDSEQWPPVGDATVRAVSRGTGGGVDVTNAAGRYSLALAPGVYDVTASAFGYEPETIWGVRAVTEATTVQDFGLTPVPKGTLRVHVVDAANREPLRATLEVLDTPYRTTSTSAAFELPAGSYTVRGERLGYRVATANVSITVGEVSEVTLALSAAPSILLMDSGGWYYESQIGYFRQALDDLSYAFDERSIRDLSSDVPTTTELAPYDIVVWSAPRDAPGYIGAGSAVGEYLEGGGRLLLSGQDVGFWDGGGALGYWSPYYGDYLKARFVDDNAPVRRLTGERGDIFAGRALTITGPGGADNQAYPDVISVADSDAAAPVLHYEGDGCGGLRVGTCLGYRAVYLPFGFEGINERSARRDVMERSLDWLKAPAPTVGLELLPQEQLGIGSSGTLVTHTVRLRHIGAAGSADQISLRLEGGSWPSTLSEESINLSPCASSTITVNVTIPPTASLDQRDVVTLKAQSSLSTSMAPTATLETKTPAPVLLVDDDRWYDQQETYVAAMEEAGLKFDVWETSVAGGGHRPGPTAKMLQRYPVVVWWTGYDWYAPLTEDEEASLEAYLEAGGRLMLSSQDYLYYHHDEPFAREHLGVLSYTEDITPTQVEGVPENLVGAGLGPWSLSYPQGYDNWSDGVVPAPDVGVAFRDRERRGVALTREEDGEATLFLPFPFEALPADERGSTAERAVGWLSWLGRSTLDVEPRSAAPGDTVTYTAAIHNDGPASVTASLSDTLPAAVDAIPDSFIGPGVFDPATETLSWRGAVSPGETVTFRYQANVVTDKDPGQSVVNVGQVVLEDHTIGFERSATVRIGAPDLSRSSFGCVPEVIRPGRTTTCTLALRNTGVADAEPATAVIYLPGDLATAAGSVSASGGVVEGGSDSLTWSGPLTAGGTATLTFQLRAPAAPVRQSQYGVAFLDDGEGGEWERPAWLTVDPWLLYLPVIGRDS